ncbi:PEPxxWA-CTERM sorting domain-containing protein [Phenylobacterium sp.]|uniref:PEPxxWA-CTERM sorting domain-containing protein n=1 Tax=Phenylobacterium sp. TaxID=1871053 RepID=UPI00374DFB39
MRLQTKLLASAIAIATLASAATAQASVVFSYPGATIEFATDNIATASFNAAAGAGLASFIIDGYASLDGQNFYEDDFTLTLNGVDILSGTFNLGGGGNDVVFFAPVGSSIVNNSGNLTNITWAGGQVMVSAPLALQAGVNTLSFKYVSLTDGHAGFQGTGDEGWGLENIQVTDSAGGVPEPASWALMMVGFGGLGAMLRRQRSQRLQLAPIRV